MSFVCGTSKVFACCRKYQHSLCLKILILIFICALMCFTCFVIENDRDRRLAEHRTQKLIQIRPFHSSGPSDDDNRISLLDDGSGDHSNRLYKDLEPHPLSLDENERNANVANFDYEGANSQEMLAASNCISKSCGHFKAPVEIVDDKLEDYDYKELMSKVEELLEIPELSRVQNDVMNYNDCHGAREEGQDKKFDEREAWQTMENIHRFYNEDEDHFLSGEEPENQGIWRLIIEPQEQHQQKQQQEQTSISPSWTSDERFFPDEVAFKMNEGIKQLTKSPTEDWYDHHDAGSVERALEGLGENSRPIELPTEVWYDPPEYIDATNEELSGQDLDLNVMIGKLLEDMSTLLVPPLKIERPRPQDLTHLANFRDRHFGPGEPIYAAPSSINPAWKSNPSHRTKLRQQYTNDNRNYRTFRRFDNFLQRIFG